MKKLIFFLFAFSFLSADWNWISSVFKKEVPTIEYTVDTSEKNPRVYEFDTQGYPKMHCVVFLRPDTTTSPAMSCVKMTKDDFEKNKKLAK
jgi:hypothetical protein